MIVICRAGKNPIFFHQKIGFLVLMNKTRFSLYKTWFYFGVGQAPGHPHPYHAHIDTTSSSSYSMVSSGIESSNVVAASLLLSLLYSTMSLSGAKQSQNALRFDLMKTSFSTVLVARAFLNFEWINPIVEKLRSDAADDCRSFLSAVHRQVRHHRLAC